MHNSTILLDLLDTSNQQPNYVSTKPGRAHCLHSGVSICVTIMDVEDLGFVPCVTSGMAFSRLSVGDHSLCLDGLLG